MHDTRVTRITQRVAAGRAARLWRADRHDRAFSSWRQENLFKLKKSSSALLGAIKSLLDNRSREWATVKQPAMSSYFQAAKLAAAKAADKAADYSKKAADYSAKKAAAAKDAMAQEMSSITKKRPGDGSSGKDRWDTNDTPGSPPGPVIGLEALLAGGIRHEDGAQPMQMHAVDSRPESHLNGDGDGNGNGNGTPRRYPDGPMAIHTRNEVSVNLPSEWELQLQQKLVRATDALAATRLEADKFRARTALLERRATAAETRAELAETETRQARNTVEDAASSTATAHKLVSEHVVPQDATLMKRAEHAEAQLKQAETLLFAAETRARVAEDDAKGAEARSVTSASAETSATQRLGALLTRVEQLEGNVADLEATSVGEADVRRAAEDEVVKVKAALEAAKTAQQQTLETQKEKQSSSVDHNLLQAEVHKLEAKVHTLETSCMESEVARNSALDSARRARETERAQKVRLVEKEKRVLALEAEATLATSSVDARIAELTFSLEKTTRRAADAEASVTALGQKIKEDASDVSNQSAESASSAAALETRAARAEGKVAQSDAATAAARTRVATVEANIQAGAAESTSLSAALKEARAACSSATLELEGAQTRIMAYEVSSDASDVAKTGADEIGTFAKKIASLEAKLVDAANQAANERVAAEDASKQKLAALTHALAEAQGRTKTLERAVAEAEARIADAEARKIAAAASANKNVAELSAALAHAEASKAAASRLSIEADALKIEALETAAAELLARKLATERAAAAEAEKFSAERASADAAARKVTDLEAALVDALAQKAGAERAAAEAKAQKVAAERAAADAESHKVAAERASASAENTKIASLEAVLAEAEAKRVTAEQAVADTEAQKVVAEQAASQAEAQRVADARAATETATRKVASLEAALAEAESRKTAAEQAAANAETQRAESETQRLTAEKSAAAASASAKAQKAEAEAQRVNAETQAAKAEKQRRDDAEQHRVASETATQNAKDAVRREDTELASSARRYKADFAAAKEIIAQREKQLLDMDAVREERDVLAQMVRALRNQEASKKLTPLKVPKWLGGLGGGKG